MKPNDKTNGSIKLINPPDFQWQSIMRSMTALSVPGCAKMLPILHRPDAWCNMGRRDLPDMYARVRGLVRTYQANTDHTYYTCMLQVCNTSGTLKLCWNLPSTVRPGSVMLQNLPIMLFGLSLNYSCFMLSRYGLCWHFMFLIVKNYHDRNEMNFLKY